MASSGIRIGAWDYLQWVHIRPIKKDNEVVAGKLIVYAGEDEEYFTFISREAWLALNDWIDYRRSSGEMITDDTGLCEIYGIPEWPREEVSSLSPRN